MSRKSVFAAVLAAVALAALPAMADTITYQVSGTSYSALTASVTLNLSASQLSITVQNTSSSPTTGYISAIGFAVPGTLSGLSLSSTTNPNFALLTSSLGNVPQYNSTVLDFGMTNGGAFASGTGNPCCTILPGQSATFIINGNFSGTTLSNLMNGTFIRWKTVGPDGEGSDVGHRVTVPEPATLVLALGSLGTMLLGVWRRRTT